MRVDSLFTVCSQALDYQCYDSNYFTLQQKYISFLYMWSTKENTRANSNTRIGIYSVLKKLCEKEDTGITVLKKDAHEHQEHHVY